MAWIREVEKNFEILDYPKSPAYCYDIISTIMTR